MLVTLAGARRVAYWTLVRPGRPRGVEIGPRSNRQEAGLALDSARMKSSDRDSPRRVSDPERTGPKVDRPRAIDQYIAYFGDRTTNARPDRGFRRPAAAPVPRSSQ